MRKQFDKHEFYNYLKENNLILFQGIVGSQAYGTATPQSDIDEKFVYILPEDYILGNGYIEQLTLTDDYVGYEIKRFLDLLSTNNPTVLELLNLPEDCIRIKQPVFDLVLQNKDKFLTKICKDSFGGYARQQIHKAKGMDKMMNWEKEKIKRKTPLDFCYVVIGEKSLPLKKWLKLNSMEQKFCGLAKIPNARDLYALFYDETAHSCFSKFVSEEERSMNKSLINYNLSKKSKSFGLGYKGVELINDELDVSSSNSLRLSSIPKGETASCIISYNKDGYISHCRDYKNYTNWIKNRNVQRWVDIENHNQKIDGKNMLHCVRLIDVALEIAEGKGLNVRRPNADYLLSIRKGKVDLETLIQDSEIKIKKIDEAFANSSLPNFVDKEFINDLLIKIRRITYNKCVS